ncbi:MAG: tetratricopeptide repeat protein, partial [Candidatus Bathyarchaeia archaeon]
PKELSDIVMRCLEKNPENRYANFKEIGMALQEIHKKLTGQYVPKSGPPSVDYQKLKGRFYSLKDLGREKEADELLKWVESVGHSDTLTDLALLFIDQHRHKDAIRVLKKAFLKDNFHRYYRREVPFLYLSVCLFNEERWGELREVTSEALKIKPDDPYLIALEGAASLFLGSPGQAIDRFQEAEKLEPGDAYLFSIIGLAFMKKNNYPQAEQWFRKALEKDDKNLCALFNLALICNDKKDYTEAISLWQRFLDVCPSDDPFRKKAQEYIVELKKIL